MTLRPDFLIAATKSGSGKTLLTLGILAALRKRGMEVRPFKCGPDFIDPSLHQMIVSRPSINLDIRMMGPEGCIASYHHYSQGADVVVVEGVMGLFDGGIASSASLAELLGIPVYLIVDVRSAAESVAAVIKGFETYNPVLKIGGIICNRVGSARHRQLIEDAVREHCSSEILGFFPRKESFEMPSRHLGLFMGHEMNYDRDQVDRLAEAVEEHIDLDRLLRLAAGDRPEPVISAGSAAKKETVRLAVARDEAFCFYYQENFDILESEGFDLVPFSPLHDEALPPNIRGVYFGGGYPELYAKTLSANSSMLVSVREWAEKGGFIYGECGGFMYLTSQITDDKGRSYPMADLFPVEVRMKKRLSRLGYREAAFLADSLLARAGTQAFGHEFHYSEIVARDGELAYLYELSDGRNEGCAAGNVFGSYVHLHFARSRALLQRLHTNLRSSITG